MRRWKEFPWKLKKSELQDIIKVVVKEVEDEVSGLHRMVQSLILLLCLYVGILMKWGGGC
jgi:hypothetical protein